MKRTALCLAFCVAIQLFCGISFAQFNGGTPPALGPVEDPGCAKTALWEGVGWSACGLAEGLFVYSHTDLVMPGPMPITLRRTYRNMGGPSVGFGPGWSFDYAMFLYPAGTGVDVIMPDGGRLYCGNTGTNTYSCTSAPDSTWFLAQITYDASIPGGGGWDLTRKDKTVYQFGYNAPLQKIVDRYRNSVTLVRASGQTGPITQISDSNGRNINLTWTNGLITEAQEFAGTTALPETVTYAYDANGRLSTVTDGVNNVTTFTYSTTSAETNNIASIKDGNLFTTTLAYTTSTGSGLAPLGSLSSITLPDTGKWTFSYTADANSNIQSSTITDAIATNRLFAFNPAGYVTSDTVGSDQTGTLHQQTTYTRNSATNFVTDQYEPLPSGQRHTVFSWDFTAGDLLSVTKAYESIAATTSYTYDNSNCYFVKTVTDPDGHVTTNTYSSDGKCNLISAQNGNGHTTTFSYNTQGQFLTTTSPMSETTTFGYGTYNDQTSITDPLANVTTKSYNPDGTLAEVFDALGDRTSYRYDADARLTAQLLPTYHCSNPCVPPGTRDTISYSYDGVGNVASMVDANSQTWQWTYWNNNRLKYVIDPNTNRVGYVYDKNGNLTEVVHGSAVENDFVYDAINRRITTKFGWNGSTWDSTVSYTYDIANRMTTAVDSKAGTITRAWDDLDRLSSDKEPKNTTTTLGTVTYGYDNVGNTTSMQACPPTGTCDPVVNYTYDGVNNLQTVQNDLGTVTIYHDADEHRSEVSLPNGINGNYAYDAASNVTDLVYSKTGLPTQDLHYQYDAANRVIEVYGSLAGLNLPTSGSVSTGAFTYNADSSPHTYTATGSTATTITNDIVGDITSGGDGTSYDWSSGRGVPGRFGGLFGAGCTLPCEILTYDPYGRRTSLNYNKVVSSTTTNYLYQGQNVVQEWTPNGEARVLNGVGLDERYARVSAAGVVSWFLVDRLGSTVALTDSSGNVQMSYIYGPFGNTQTVAGTQMTNDNPYEFGGREADPMTGMYYLRGRYLDTGLSRFVARDPAGFLDGGHLYNYAGNSPTRGTDPTGRFCCGGPGSFPVGGWSEAWAEVLGNLSSSGAGPAGPTAADAPADESESAMAEAGGGSDLTLGAAATPAIANISSAQGGVQIAIRPRNLLPHTASPTETSTPSATPTPDPKIAAIREILKNDVAGIGIDTIKAAIEEGWCTKEEAIAAGVPESELEGVSPSPSPTP